MHGMDCDHRGVILNLLGERIGQASKAQNAPSTASKYALWSSVVTWTWPLMRLAQSSMNSFAHPASRHSRR